MKFNKNSEFPMVLIGKQVLNGAVIFKNAVKLIKNKSEFKAFKKDIQENCEAMWGKGCEDSSTREFDIKFSPEAVFNYETWTYASLSSEDVKRIEIN